MNHRTRRTLFVVGALFSASFVALAACSNDDQFLRLPQATNNGTDASTGSDAAGEQDAGVNDAGCSTLRTSPRIYCFGARSLDDAGSGCATAEIDASSPEICCADESINGTFTPAKCAATTASANGYATGKCGFSNVPDAGGREWHCLESQHCPEEAPACCVAAGWKGNPTAGKDTKAPAVCSQFYNSASQLYVSGTRCRSACAQGELLLCGKDADCGEGQKCDFLTLGSFFTGTCQSAN